MIKWIDIIIENVSIKLGDIQYVYLAGDLVRGNDTGIIDIILVGNVDYNLLYSLVNKVEGLINRKLRFLVYNIKEWNSYQKNMKQKYMLLWKPD